MNKNIKYIIPMIAIAGFALTSCNKATSEYLKRETFDTSIKKLENLLKIADDMKAKQYELKKVNVPSSNETVDFPFYKLPDKGTVTTNINIAFSGSIRILEYHIGTPTHPSLSIDVNNVNILIQDKITIEWDLTHNDYFRCTNRSGASYFIQKNAKGQWIKYFETPIGNKKYGMNITSYIGASEKTFNPLNQFGSFKNYALYQIAASNGLFVEEEKKAEKKYIKGFGLGISGFTGDGADVDPKINRMFISNAYAPGMLFSNKFKIDEDYPMYRFIDEVAANKALIKTMPIKARHTKKSNGTALSTSIGISTFKFKNTQAFFDELKKEMGDDLVDAEVTANGSGSGKLDYFSGFKNNWINQTEFSLSLNNANLQFYLYRQNEEYPEYSDVFYINIKDVYSHSYINQDFNNGICKYKQPDTSGYILINPPEAK